MDGSFQDGANYRCSVPSPAPIHKKLIDATSAPAIPNWLELFFTSSICVFKTRSTDRIGVVKAGNSTSTRSDNDRKSVQLPASMRFTVPHRSMRLSLIAATAHWAGLVRRHRERP